MTEMAPEFSLLPPEYQRLLRLVQEHNNIVVKPLQQLKGGLSGAYIFLVSVSAVDTAEVKHLVLKLDRPYPGERDEIERHNIVIAQAPSHFARKHVPEIAFDTIELEGLIAVFYQVAGESLLKYRPLAAYEQQQQLESIFELVATDLLTEWNSGLSFEVVQPQSLLAKWLKYRIEPGSRIEHFLEENQHINSDMPGLLLGDIAYPNPLLYAQKTELWELTRSIDAMIGFQHGDLNTNNILVRFAEDGREIEGYYVIDFALFEERTPLLFDHVYLELAYLLRYLETVPINVWIRLILLFAEQDILDLQQVPTELTGPAKVTGGARKAFGRLVQTAHRSLADDLWGQYWLAAVAAGLNFCNKSGVGEQVRLASLLYAAAHMKRYCMAFGVPLPSETRPIYLEGQPGVASPGRMTSATSSTLHRWPLEQVEPFFGRKLELGKIVILLSSPTDRLVTIAGPGGVGKTRLALEAAGEMERNFAQGVYFVPLAHLDSSALLAQSIAEAINFPLSTQEEPDSQLLGYLRNKEMLLVLDNFEHLLDGAALLSRVLHIAPGVTMLVTSRQRLELLGETVITLEGMPFSRWDTLEEALSDSAVQLFLLGAKRAQEDFSVASGDLPYLARVLRLTEGMPLGILLAAGWANLLSLKEISDEISGNLDFLETELRDVPARQQSMRAVFETSWNRLSGKEKDLLKKLSLFKVSFSRQVAHEVAGASLRDLAGLINKSILRRESGSGRYSIHELLRQYVEERLEHSPAELSLARTKHADYFAEFMLQNWGALTGEGQKEALKEIVLDIENVRTAWHHHISQNNFADVGRYLDSIWMVYDVQGWYRAADDLFGDAVKKIRRRMEVADHRTTSALLAQLLARQAYFAGLLGRPEQGWSLAEEGVSILRKLDREGDLVIPLLALNMNAVFMDKSAAVEMDVQEALESAKAKGDHWGEAMILTWLASRALADRDYQQANRLAQQSSNIFEELGESWGLAWSSGVVLGSVAVAQGDYSEARKRYRRGLDAARDIDYRRAIQHAYNNLGHVALLTGDPQEAERYFLQSLHISEDIGQTREMVETLFDIARVRAAQDKKEEAVRLTVLVLSHPSSAQRSLFGHRQLRKEAELLRKELEAALAPKVYETTLSSDSSLDFETVISSLLHPD
jgi:predicted ATPase/Tfp pilus assembly protein PilF